MIPNTIAVFLLKSYAPAMLPPFTTTTADRPTLIAPATEAMQPHGMIKFTVAVFSDSLKLLTKATVNHKRWMRIELSLRETSRAYIAAQCSLVFNLGLEVALFHKCL